MSFIDKLFRTLALLPFGLFTLAGCATVNGGENVPVEHPEGTSEPPPEEGNSVPAAPTPDSYIDAQKIPEIVDLINDVRRKGRRCGKKYYPAAKPVAWNEQLAEAALSHSRDMVVRGYFEHDNPDGMTPGHRAIAAGYIWTAIGENIAKDSDSPLKTVEVWVKSPGHCENMMDRRMAEIGAARAVNYWTLVLGRR